MESRMQTSLVALRRILRATELNARALGRATGLSVAQLLILEIVAANDPIAPSKIAQAAGISHATATSLIDKLESRGLVARTRGEVDRRIIWVSLTDEGREALANAPDPLQRVYSAQFGALPAWEQAMIVAALERIAAMLDAGAIDASPLLDVGEIDSPAKRDC
jgi:DNA-binding MarR family transcriptional regulator